jgi:bacillithiol system protein YtxJ
VVPVQASRDVSAALAERFGIRHESPQVMVVHDGQVVWHGSHFRATAGSITAALERLKTERAAARPPVLHP